MNDLTLILIADTIDERIQSFTQYNLIIINNSGKITNDPNVYHLEKKKTFFYCVNEGIKHVKTKYFAFADLNDEFVYNKFNKQLDFMKKNNLLLSLCLTNINTKILLSLRSMLIHRSVINKIGYFVDNNFGSEIDFLLRFMKQYEPKFDWQTNFNYKNNIGFFKKYNYYGFIPEVLHFNNVVKPLSKNFTLLTNALKKKYINSLSSLYLDHKTVIKFIKHNNQKTIFNDFNQIYISKSLQHLNRIVKKYNLTTIIDLYKPALFFGLYNKEDIKNLINHKGKKAIIWGGTDINSNKRLKNIELIKTLDIDTHYAISKNIEERLKELNIKYIYLDFNLVDKNIFKKIDNFGDKIYIYNGFSKGNEKIYNKELYESIIKKLPEYKFILSNELKLKNKEMMNIYKKCFIGLRLTKNDGNANTVQEFEQIGIPIIHNFSDYGIKWKSQEDIVLNIKYKHIDKFNKSIKQFDNILFFCSDYPGYGGAATNCYKLLKYYSSLGKNVLGVFLTNEKCYLKFDKNIKIISSELELSKINFKPDLIILRNFIRFNIKKYFDSQVYFFIPGIFLPNLKVNYKKLLNKEELDNYIHPNILKTCVISDKIFIASYDSMRILKKYYSFKPKILPFNYIPFHNHKFNSNFYQKDYKYGLVVSNFNRKVKNLDTTIEHLKNINEKIILIGKNSSKYKKYFDCIELVHPDKIYNYYKKIKYLIQNSYYESCSNVLLEGKYFNCKHILFRPIIIFHNKKKLNFMNKICINSFYTKNIPKIYSKYKIKYKNIPNKIYKIKNKLDEWIDLAIEHNCIICDSNILLNADYLSKKVFYDNNIHLLNLTIDELNELKGKKDKFYFIQNKYKCNYIELNKYENKKVDELIKINCKCSLPAYNTTLFKLVRENLLCNLKVLIISLEYTDKIYKIYEYLREIGINVILFTDITEDYYPDIILSMNNGSSIIAYEKYPKAYNYFVLLDELYDKTKNKINDIISKYSVNIPEYSKKFDVSILDKLVWKD